MADGQSLALQSIDSFFIRSGLTVQDRLDCFAFVEELYPDKSISPTSCQGYCSMTTLVGEHLIVQFRPSKYRLNLLVTSAARDVYGTFAPETKYIATLPASGLLVYIMDRIRGITFKDLQASSGTRGISTQFRARLCRDFAVFLSRSWHRGAEKPMELGTVGRSIKTRLQSLCKDLPIRFRATARHILTNLHHIEALPCVLTHGDIVPANIMVNPSTGALTGLVDWAEAEFLPFGICLYGLEELLGKITPGGFQYSAEAERLRNVFWTELRRNIPALQNIHVLQVVKLARDLGILLWHGIAFDDGAIDRVVQEGRDIEEIQRLDSFLDVEILGQRDHKPKL
ncbi:uncharacterized protein RCO7_09517 [Rhynchosporium graminicola]|uniref:Aminoglycoside phosphotransferase domain-containing protein n=1 Tax=Rhynchosporium graminicola TaxID=2792576 RepID=A0A1E1K678_9HELO|nr:uncharacterized protein RCO7_09517 [Rhynchosporium commune]